MKIKLSFSAVVGVVLLAFLFSLNANAKKNDKGQSLNAKDFIDINTFPSWFIEAMSLEKKVKKKTRLKIEQFNVNSKIRGKVKLVEESEGTWLYNIDIGTDSPVECYVFSEFDGPSNSLYGVVDAVFTEGIPQLHNQPVSNRYNYAIGSGVIEDIPYMLFDTLYVIGDGDQKQIGILKALSAQTDNSLQLCMHHEPGYRETFFTVFKSFVDAFSKNDENPEFLEVIYQLTVDDIPVGYSREKYTADDDGDIEIETDSSLLFPVDASSVSRSDNKVTSWSNANGALINGSKYSISNSTLSSSLSIQNQNGKWQVGGELQGKEVNYELEYDDWLISEYGFYLGIEDLAKSDQNSTEYQMWLPDADPSSALKVEISKLQGNPKANYRMSLGPLIMQVMADKKGMIKSGDINQGPISMEMNVIYSKGQPSL